MLDDRLLDRVNIRVTLSLSSLYTLYVFVAILLIVYLLFRLDLGILFFVSNRTFISVSILLSLVVLLGFVLFLVSFTAGSSLESFVSLLDGYKYAVVSSTAALLALIALLIINTDYGLALFAEVDITALLLGILLFNYYIAYVGNKRVRSAMKDVFLGGVTLYDALWLLKKVMSIVEDNNDKKPFLLTPDIPQIQYIIKGLQSEDLEEAFNKFIEKLYGSRSVMVLNYEALRSEMSLLKIWAIIKAILAMVIAILFLIPTSVLPIKSLGSSDIFYLKVILGVIITVKAPVFLIPIIIYYYFMFIISFVGKISMVVNPVEGVIIEMVIIFLSFLLNVILILIPYYIYEDSYTEAKIQKIINFLNTYGILVDTNNTKHAKEQLKTIKVKIEEIIEKANKKQDAIPPSEIF